MLANQFVEWWSDATRFADFERFFVVGLSYSQRLDTNEQEMIVFKDDDALWYIRQHPPWLDLEAESKMIAPEVVQISGRGTDPVTGLQYEIRWKLVIKESKIWQVDEVFKAIVDNEQAHDPPEQR